MKVILAVVLIATLYYACGRVAHSADGVRVTPFPGSRDARGVHIAYLVEAATPVAITVSNGETRVSAVTTSGGWAATVTGTLDECDGVLVVGDETIVQQRCTWLPVGARR